MAVRTPAISVIGAQCEAAIRADLDVVGPLSDRHIECRVVAYPAVLDFEHGDLVAGKLGYQRPVACRRDGHRRHLLAHLQSLHEAYRLAVDL